MIFRHLNIIDKIQTLGYHRWYTLGYHRWYPDTRLLPM